MAATIESVLQDLKQRHYAPVYFLQGDEKYYIDLISSIIEKDVLDESEKAFNQTVLYGKDCQLNQILTQAKRFPMMAEKQVVIVKEAQELQDLNKESEQKLLENYLLNPVPSTILVFCYKNKSLDKRKSLSKVLEKHATVVHTKKLYDNQISRWINTFINEQGYSIDQKAIQVLANSIGNDLSRLSSEIKKIFINIEKSTQIDSTLVEKYVGISKEYNVFELQNAMTVKNILKANQIIDYFSKNPKNNPIIPIISILFAFYCKIILVHQSKDSSERGLASLLKVNPFFVKEYLIAAKNYPLQKTVENIQHIQQADLLSKGVDNPTVNEGEILKMLIYKLLH